MGQEGIGVIRSVLDEALNPFVECRRANDKDEKIDKGCY